MIVKHGDTHTVQWRANVDLTGATARLLAKQSGDPVVELPATVEPGTDGLVTHTLTGTLPSGAYGVELEATFTDRIVTFPNSGYAELIVLDDLG